MSMQNEMRRQKKTNLEFSAKRLRQEIQHLAQSICLNLDTSLIKADDLPIAVIDDQFDELKGKWSELTVALGEINRLNEELR